MVKTGKRQGDDHLYEVAEHFRQRGWASDDSVFTPGRAVWTLKGFDALHRDFVNQPDESGRRFEVKLEKQLANTDDDAIQLMAELLYFHLVVSSVIGAPKKQELVEHVLSWMNEPVGLPEQLLPALGMGCINPGTYFNTGRPAQLRFLIEAGQLWKQQDGASQQKLISDPWAFKAFVAQIPERGAASQRHALLHLLFPSEFEAIVSEDHIGKIIDRFQSLTSGKTEDTDRQLQEIREALTPRYGEEFDFYNPRLKPLWQQGIDPWGEVVSWASRLYASPAFDEEERAYKLQVVEALPDAIAALQQGGEWLRALQDAFEHPKNNLIDWRVKSNFLGWSEAEPDVAKQALTALWSADAPEDGVREFSALTQDPLTTPGNRTNVASLLLMGIDPTAFPIYKPAPFKKIFDLVGRVASSGPEEERYAEAVRFCDELIDEARTRELQLRDRLDAQSVIWAITNSEPDSKLLEHFSAEEKQAFFAWREGASGSEADSGPEDDTESQLGPPPEGGVDWLQWAARECHFPIEYIEEVVGLLKDKGQIVLYGPPGTGKTFVAQVLADALCEKDEDRVALVQFHPSTTYEDFFEGIRPETNEDGQLLYGVRKGPLALMAEAASEAPEKQFVMVIDELNRANLPKVLGEMLFLFEYRTRGARTLYRPKTPFKLPENLWFIGTMNTVDRSVALIDAAMRRRFHFVSLYPDRAPVSEVLASICSESEAWVAELVDRVNAELVEDLGGRDHQLGPSHFIRADRTPDGLARIWRYTIEPLIEDQLFGQEERVAKYRWAAVTRRHAELVPGVAFHPEEDQDDAVDEATEDD